MNAVIRYALSEAGRKANILAGGNGNGEQTLIVTPTDPEFAACVAAGTVGPAAVEIDTTYSFPRNLYDGTSIAARKWDTIPTVADVLADESRRATEHAALKDTRDREAADKHAADVTHDTEIVRERRTKTATISDLAGVAHEYHEPAECLLPEVSATPEAVAWLAELATEKAAAQAAADAGTAAEKVRRTEAAALAEVKKAERRQLMGLEDGQVAYRVEDGALTGVPCWEKHSRGKNWMATISVNPSSPGGLERDFCEKARGSSYYILPTFFPGDAIEFGADYYSGRGRKNSKRWYGYVVDLRAYRPAIDEDGQYLVVVECDSGKAACKEGAKWAKDHPSMNDPANAIDAAIAHVNGEGRIVANEPSQN
jgi:hypothetical protein